MSLFFFAVADNSRLLPSILDLAIELFVIEGSSDDQLFPPHFEEPLLVRGASGLRMSPQIRP